LGKGLEPQMAGIAQPAGRTGCVGVVASTGHGIIDPQGQSRGNDLGLGQVQKRRVDADRLLSLDTYTGGQVREVLKGIQKCRAAVRVSAVVEGVDAQKDVRSFQYLSVPKGNRQKDGVACRNIRDRNARR
jgi:hypothetical protein